MTAADRIALVGPRAAGKSTLAARLGVRLGWPVVDTDARLGAQSGGSAGDLLVGLGEAAFRGLEERVCLEALAAPGPRVVALGGGAVLSPAVRAALRRPGVLAVLLIATPATLVARQRGRDGRPPLTDLPLEGEVRAVLRARLRLYRDVAGIRINTATANVDACVARIFAKMRGVR